MDTTFLHSLAWRRLQFEWEVEKAAQLPPFPGPAIRGSLGWTVRDEFGKYGERCRGICDAACQAPADCRFHHFFLQDRLPHGGGRNLPKPWVLHVLHCTPSSVWPESLSAGAKYEFGLTLFGEPRNWTGRLIARLAQNGLTPGGGLLRLTGVRDLSDAGRTLWSKEWTETPIQTPLEGAPSEAWWHQRARCVRVEMRTPLDVRLAAKRNAQLTPAEWVRREFLHHCLMHVSRLYESFCLPAGQRLPWVSLKNYPLRISEANLRVESVLRYSSPQKREMWFHGLVGSVELEGDLTPWMPVLRTAEVVHMGGRVTFGFGQLSVEILAE